MKPKITIITVCFNSENTLKQTIESVLHQTYTNIEYIIIDGKSTDKTVEIIKSYQTTFAKKEITYKWISELDKGIYNAFNKALERVSGEWIVFIGSDDCFKENATLANVIPFLNQAEQEKSRFVYGKITHINKANQEVETIGKPWKIQKKRFTYMMNIGHSGSFHHKSIFLEHGNFNESFKIAGDYEFLLREFKNTNKEAFFIDNVVILMKEGGISARLDNRLTLIKETQKARKLNNITAFSRELAFWELKVRTLSLLSKIFGNSFAAKTADFYRHILGKNKRWTH